MNRKLGRALRRLGATDEELEDAAHEGWLALLTVDKLLMPGPRRYRVDEVAARAGVEPDSARQIWRALGFPDVPPDEPRFTDGDIEALQLLESRRRRTPLPIRGTLEEALTEQVRVFSASLSRLAEVVADTLVEVVRAALAGGVSDEDAAMILLDGLDWPSLRELYDYTLRLQTRDALWRRLAAEDPDAPIVAVGFVDLVGYTALSQLLEADELTALVRRFEELAFDTVAEEGGRVVKTIGDEVMFVATDIGAAARIARRLTERSADDELLPEARAGLAVGAVVARDGDYFGPVVNLASRLVEITRPGTVVVSDEVHAALADDPGFEWKRLRPRRLRDIGRVEVWGLTGVAPMREEAVPR